MRWLITGVNRGIGKALAMHLLKEGEEVIGISRKPYESVLDMKRKYGLKFIEADLSVEEDIEGIAKHLEEPVDFLMNNAGILIKENFPDFSQENFLKTMKVNSFAPLKLSAILFKYGKIKDGSKIINTSSIMGSISQSSATSSYSYSISKAALNMVTKLLSHQLRGSGITVISVHPGWVRTDMGGSAAPVLPEESAAGIIELARKISLKDSGKFFDYTGRELPW